MCNNEKQRNDEAKSLGTISLWAHLDNIREVFTNENYLPDDEVWDFGACTISHSIIYSNFVSTENTRSG
jgi:hypothetical protein